MSDQNHKATGITNILFIHQAIRADLQAQSERMATLDRTGTYLKHFGRKQDTIYVKNLLVGIRLRWKKILRRTDERGRLLQQAYKEDKRVSFVTVHFQFFRFKFMPQVILKL